MLANTTEGYVLGTVVSLYYREWHWPPGKFSPYEIQVDHGPLVNAPEDTDEYVRHPDWEEELRRRMTPQVDAEGNPLSFGKNENCVICVDKMRDPIHLPCGHWYCEDCIEGLRQSGSVQDTCPVCRKPLPPGPEQMWDAACQKDKRARRKVERLSNGWPPEVQREMDEVTELYRKAADQGHQIAQYNLANMYLLGQGVPQNTTKTKELYELAAVQGYGDAQHNLALTIFKEARGLEDYTLARQWYETAAAPGFLKSMNCLAFMYRDGDGVPRNCRPARDQLS